jgi:hypothetical protein
MKSSAIARSYTGKELLGASMDENTPLQILVVHNEFLGVFIAPLIIFPGVIAGPRYTFR